MRLLTALLLCGMVINCLATPIKILNMRLWEQTQHSSRLVFDLSAAATHHIFTLKNPHRVVIDFKETQPNTPLATIPHPHPFLKKIRSAPRNQHDLRVVLDLKTKVSTKSFLLQPSGIHGHRLVVDMNTAAQPQKVAEKKTRPQPMSESLSYINQNYQSALPAHPLIDLSQPADFKKPKTSGRDVIIAIDAGHGGIDPGASGQQGSLEKDVVLAIAQDLAGLITQEQGMHAVLTRSGDYFLKLRRRIELARYYQADLLISIHADAYPEDERARGASVYILSRSGASSEAAKWLAEKENSADLLGGVRLSDKDDLLASVLLDLSQTSTLAASAHLGNELLTTLKQRVGTIHQSRLQRAGFMVLRSPDIPSVLIETTFISNPQEEQKLNQTGYRHQVARAILEGIRGYFAEFAPADTLLARR